MYVKRVAETILTSCLFLSRVWARPSEVVCDGGRGEGDKWFDGCKWCICQRSGPLCSSSECSHLVSLVAPCQKVDSRWWDGCYHCQCNRHGIECTVDDTCRLLMRNERYGLEFLSHDACLDPKDGQCICGVDGVPSCTAVVIDRNSHSGTTVVLNPIFPAASSIISPRPVYYHRPYTNNNRGIRADRPSFDTDTLYINYQYGAVEKHSNGQLKTHHHSLVKRHTSRNKKHSPAAYSTERRRSQNSKHNHAAETRKSSSHSRSNSRKHFAKSLSGKGSRGRRKYQDVDTIYARDEPDSVLETNLRKSNEKSQYYPKDKWRESYLPADFTSSYSQLQNNAHRDRFETFPSTNKKEMQEFDRLESLSVDTKFKKRTDMFKGGTLEGKYLNDDTVTGNIVNNSSASLLIASYNRCRWGVRWYGGSLRCYCGLDNSITCGDPSFVASRIDGFRLELASCEEGQVWDDDDLCRECECQIRGVALCKRSPSCPLPYLIQPLPIDPDDNGKYGYVNRTDPSSMGQTGEFTGKEEQKVVYDNDTQVTPQDKRDNSNVEEEEVRDLEIDVYTDTESDNITVVDTTDGKIKYDGEMEEPNLITGSVNDSTEIGSKNDSTAIDDDDDSKQGEQETEGSVWELDGGATRHPDVVIAEDDTSTTEGLNIILEDNVDGGKGDNRQEMKNNILDDVNNNNLKRATQVLVGECKPLSRWLDGCKRCQCDKDGKKLCDDSRCLKAMPVSPGMINISSDKADRRQTRPMQRPPPGLFQDRDGPINLQPPFMGLNLCGRFAVGQKYWDECNICLCTLHGPKCTAKNCT